MIHLHDATSWDDWFSLKTAWTSLVPANASPLVPHFYFTRIAGLKGCGEQPHIEQHLRAPFKAIKELQQDIVARPPSLALKIAEEFLQNWASAGSPALRDMNIILCGEPVWFCPILDRLLGRPMLVRFNMAVLDEYPSDEVAALNAWWAEFFAFVARGRSFISVGTRYTVEQVAYQTYGEVRLPYVPFLGLPMIPQGAGQPASRDEVLLFQNNLAPMLSFKMVLRMMEVSLPERERPPPILDMNDLPAGLCRPDMASFRAAVLLPHNPAPIRLVDLYAQGVVMYVPTEPLMHRWIWGNRPFGGYRAPSGYTAMAPKYLVGSLGSAAAVAVPPPDNHPPYSATAYLVAWSPTKHVDDRRYWLQYVEWELLPGLRRFSGISDLLVKLRHDDPKEFENTRVTMHLHLQARRSEALAWWRAALAAPGMLETSTA
eukprot:TRINITY_DN15363_c0_g2_i2.p1 TRINITY_DN15363_c0_g2~~TRINITY_DN15363_c0_g2_i2.p1  ORF type:complete len:430 (+),score=92.29 TRINITY_DN15363_c0_g2_i2:961-2250(+)